MLSSSSATGGRCEGTNRDDDIIGTQERDVIFALGGYDLVVAGDGQDELHGDGGGDFLTGDSNNDVSYGGDGGDIISDAGGDDVLNGGDGGDLMDGKRGDDVLRGEDGSETLSRILLLMYGGRGNDELYGGNGDDGMAGQAGRDRHYGGRDDDLIDATVGERGIDARDFVDCGRGNDLAIVLPNDRVLGNCEDVERQQVIIGVAAQEAQASAEEEQQRVLERFLAEREAKR